MSDYLQPGQHPDPDMLSAFAENVLPEHERLRCLAHLAECPACREVVYLVQEPLPAEPLPPVAAEPVSFWKRWFAPIPVLSAAAALGTLVLSVWLYPHLKPTPNAPEMATIVKPAPEPPFEQSKAIDQPAAESLPPAKVHVQRQPAFVPAAVPPPAPASPVATEAAVQLPASSAPVAAAPSSAPAVAINKDSAATTGIAGTVTDAAGAPVAGAAVRLRPLSSPAGQNLTSDPKGQFNVDGLEPGRYELQVAARGFKMETRQVDIQPNQMARADSTLSLGSVSSSISVTAESAQVQLSSSERQTSAVVEPLPAQRAAKSIAFAGLDTVVATLPSKLPAVTSVAQGKVMLAADSAGALFLSQNGGKTWKAVKSVWQGKVASLVALPTPASSSDPAFRLSTDSGTIWLSRDGNRWFADPSKK